MTRTGAIPPRAERASPRYSNQTATITTIGSAASARYVIALVIRLDLGALSGRAHAHGLCVPPAFGSAASPCPASKRGRKAAPKDHQLLRSNDCPSYVQPSLSQSRHPHLITRVSGRVELVAIFRGSLVPKVRARRSIAPTVRSKRRASSPIEVVESAATSSASSVGRAAQPSPAPRPISREARRDAWGREEAINALRTTGPASQPAVAKPEIERPRILPKRRDCRRAPGGGYARPSRHRVF